MDPIAGTPSADGDEPSGTLGPLAERSSLREQIAYALRAAIVSGELRPGVLYSAPSLAAQFHVSTTPVREAMLDLATDGMVEAVRNKGFRITEVSDKQLDEITELRALIEVPTVARIGAVITGPQVEGLAALAARICESATDGDLIGYIEADRRFHVALIALGGNEKLVQVVNQLRTQTRLYGLSRLVQDHSLIRSAEEHVELLDALMSNDVSACEELMRRHIGHVRGIWAPKGAR